MREILFRGQRVHSREWIYGSLLIIGGECFIFPEDSGDSPDNYNVDPETVGQFVDIEDTRTLAIYEGDIITGVAILSDSYGYDSKYPIKGVVRYDKEYSAFAFTENIKQPVENYYSFLWQLDGYETKVIGNIHDNKDLLK